ncbi:MAG: ATP-binding cassette domain-containing protein [Bacilli bacterium]|nr:ATP-binding cassette domain-containing protein [Bacilli bacterium]
MNVIKQRSSNDCATACLLSIMNYYGCEAIYEELSIQLKINNNGTNAYNIINISRCYGFDGYGIHYTYDEIVNNKISFPIICHVIKNNMYHFIVVYSISKKYLIINDPSSNMDKITKEEFRKIYLNTSLVLYPIKKINNISKIKSYFDFIFDYLKIEKRTIIKMIIISMITILLGILTNYYMLILIDIILPKYDYIFLCFMTILFVFVYINKNIFEYIKNKLIIYLNNKIFSSMSINTLRVLFNLPYLFFKNKSTGEVMSRINDLDAFKDLLSNILITLITNTILILFCSIILIKINIKLFLINSIQIIIYVFLIVIYRNVFTKKTDELLLSYGSYNKTLNENINGYENNKNLNLIDNKTKEIEVKHLIYINSLKRYEELINKQAFIKNFLVDIINLIIIFISITYIHNGYITLGELILFNTILYYFNEPFKNIIDLSYKNIYLKDIYYRIRDLLLMKKESDEIKELKLREDISIKNLKYSYNGIDNVFSNINLNIPYKSKLLIYSKSGYGKSTLMKILMKYIDDYNGEIYIGNYNLKDISSYVISDNFTYVSQNSYINNDTLKNNIIYGRNISDNDYEAVINICNLNKLRDNSKLRNSFMIEDNGFNISGGERQKIILARSLLKKSNYIILDEALSEISVKEEKEIIDKIMNIYHDKTIIYISHKKEIISMFNDKYELERSEVYNN